MILPGCWLSTWYWYTTIVYHVDGVLMKVLIQSVDFILRNTRVKSWWVLEVAENLDGSSHWWLRWFSLWKYTFNTCSYYRWHCCIFLCCSNWWSFNIGHNDLSVCILHTLKSLPHEHVFCVYYVLVVVWSILWRLFLILLICLIVFSSKYNFNEIELFLNLTLIQYTASLTHRRHTLYPLMFHFYPLLAEFKPLWTTCFPYFHFFWPLRYTRQFIL